MKSNYGFDRVGELGLVSKLKWSVKKLDLGQDMIIHWGSPYEKLLPYFYYGATDIFVLPSTGRTESFGIVLLDAASAGLPIVVSSLDTFRAFIRDGYNGLVTKLGDIDSLAETINRLLSEPALRQKMGQNARNKVKDYSWQEIAKTMEKVYEKAITKA